MHTFSSPANAKRILLLGEKIDAAEAYRVGLVDHLVSDETVLDKSLALAASVLEAEAPHVHAIKAMI